MIHQRKLIIGWRRRWRQTGQGVRRAARRQQIRQTAHILRERHGCHLRRLVSPIEIFLRFKNFACGFDIRVCWMPNRSVGCQLHRPERARAGRDWRRRGSGQWLVTGLMWLAERKVLRPKRPFAVPLRLRLIRLVHHSSRYCRRQFCFHQQCETSLTSL